MIRKLRIVLFALCYATLSNTLFAQTVVFTQEAEDGDLTNAGVAVSAGGCSNKSGSGLIFMRGDQSGDGDRYVSYTGINVSKAGTYSFELTYFAKNESQLEIIINDTDTIIEKDFASPGFCFETESAKYTFDIELKEGDNNLKLSPVEGINSPYLDVVTIIELPNGEPVNSIVVASSNDSIAVLLGGTLQFSAEVSPEDAAVKEVTWSVVNDIGRASITNEGLLTAEKPGMVTVVAAAQDNSGVTDSLAIEVVREGDLVFGSEAEEGDLSNAEVSISAGGCGNKSGDGLIFMGGLNAGEGDRVVEFGSITVDTDGIYNLEIGYFANVQSELEVIINEDDTIIVSSFQSPGFCFATSSALLVVPVELKSGENKLALSPVEGIQSPYLDRIEIYTKVVPVTNVLVSSMDDIVTLIEGETLQMSATIEPENATNVEVNWSVANENGEATIDQDGLLQAIKQGVVTVSATANGISGSLQINIVEETILQNLHVSGPQIYPNPTSDYFQLSNQEGIDELMVFDSTGKQFRIDKENGLYHVNNLPKGFYLLQVKHQKNVETLRLIIK